MLTMLGRDLPLLEDPWQQVLVLKSPALNVARLSFTATTSWGEQLGFMQTVNDLSG
jgi:hypothetical protein